MATGQTHCPSCSEELAGDEAPTGDGQPLICSICSDAVAVQRRGKWKPVMQLTGKRELLSNAMPSDLVLAAWPGQYRQDVFLVDDRKAARKAVG
jgi:hypothetical protein